MRRRKKRSWDDMYQEILQASAASENKTGALRITLADSLEDRVKRRKAQEKKRDVHQDMFVLLRQQTEMLHTLVDLEVQQSYAHLLLQSIDNSILGQPYNPPQHSK
ncbi:unnamed protein product [Caretta caretta]